VLVSSIKKCVICGCEATIAFPLCIKCLDIIHKKEDEDLKKINNLLDKDKSLDVFSIAQSTEIPLKVIKWYCTNGKLDSNSKKGKLFLRQNELSISNIRYEKYILFVVSGKLGTLAAYDLKRYLNSLIDEGWLDIILDMSSTTFISPVMVKVVTSVFERLRGIGSIQIANPDTRVKNIMGIKTLAGILQ
jgi:anti-anti-sigma regulatory factor